jgi:hypothetical protein
LILRFGIPPPIVLGKSGIRTLGAPSMTLGPNAFNPSPTLPTLADIRRRCKELLAHQSRHKSAQAGATLAEPPAEEDLRILEEFMREQEEQQESAKFRAEFEDPYAVEEPEPPAVLPPGSSAPPRPALDATALQRAQRSLRRTLPLRRATPFSGVSTPAKTLFPAPSSPREVHFSQPTFVRPQGDPGCINLKRTPSR